MVENHAVVSSAVEEEAATYLGPTVKPDNKVSNILMCTTLLELLELFGFTLSLVYRNCELLKSVFSEICSY